MSESDREELDAEVQQSIVEINAAIERLKRSIDSDDSDDADNDRAPNPDLRAHQHTVVICLFDALRQVVASMQSLKSARTQQLREKVEASKPPEEWEEERRKVMERERRMAEMKAAKAAAEKRKREETNATERGDRQASDGELKDDDGDGGVEHVLPRALSKVVSSSLNKFRLGGSSSGSMDRLNEYRAADQSPDDASIDDGPPPIVLTAQEQAYVTQSTSKRHYHALRPRGLLGRNVYNTRASCAAHLYERKERLSVVASRK